MSEHRRTVDDAREVLAKSEVALLDACEPLLAAEFLVSAALLATNESRTVDLAQVLEFLDVRQRVALTAREVASLLALLTQRGFLKLSGHMVSFTDSGWDALPRTKARSLATSKRDKPKWLALVR